MANQSFNFPATNPLWDGYSEYLPESFPQTKGYLHPLQQNSDIKYAFGDTNPNSYFRAVDTFNDANVQRVIQNLPEPYRVAQNNLPYLRSPLSDIYSTGAIRGTGDYHGAAYFNEAFPEISYRSPLQGAVTGGPYRSDSRQYNPQKALSFDQVIYSKTPENTHASTNWDEFYGLEKNPKLIERYSQQARFYFPEHKNLFIEASPEFVSKIYANENPLYGRAAKQGSGYLYVTPPEKAYKLSELPTGVERNGPELIEPTFLQRINPANRKGLRITQTDPVNIAGVDNPNYYMHDQIYVESGKGDPSKLGPEWQVSKTQNGTRVYRFIGNHNGSLLVPEELTSARTTFEPPNAKVLYDRITPAGERSIPQHARNAVFEAKVFLNQPEVRYAADVVKGAGKIGLNAAGLVGYAGAIAEKGPLAAVEWGVPLTRMRMGIGPILTADAPTLDIAREREERNLELRKQKALILGEPNSIHPAFNRTYNEPLDLPSADEDMRKILGL